MRVNVITILAGLIAAVPLANSAPARSGSAGIEITSVGHEGFLLRGGDASVLLDGFIGPGESERDTLIRDSIRLLLAGRPPFDGVTLALISHPHDDHFHPLVAGSFLERHPRTTLATTSEVVASLRQDFPGYAAIKGHLVEVKWGSSRRVTRTFGNVRVDFVRFAHEASQFYPDDVAIHIVHINGLNVLHGADAELLHGQLLELSLEKEALDGAFLPYSFLASPGAGRLYAEHVRAKRLVAMHLPSAGIEQAKAEVLRQFPNAIFLIEPLETVRL